jgi:hypothetical protein
MIANTQWVGMAMPLAAWPCQPKEHVCHPPNHFLVLGTLLKLWQMHKEVVSGWRYPIIVQKLDDAIGFGYTGR